MVLRIELGREVDGRWIAQVPEMSGVMCYAATREEALAKVKALALFDVADRLEHGEASFDLDGVMFDQAA